MWEVIAYRRDTYHPADMLTQGPFPRWVIPSPILGHLVSFMVGI